MYDSEIGKFIQVDGLTHIAPNWTPYRYGYSNPIIFKDPSGNNEETIYVDSKGKELHKSEDKLDNSVVVVDDRKVGEFKRTIGELKKKGLAHDDKTNTSLKKLFGKTYLAKEYWDNFDKNHKAKLGNWQPEVGTYLYDINGKMKLGNEKVPGDNFRTYFNERGPDGNNASRLHDHPNVGLTDPLRGSGHSGTSGQDTDNAPAAGSLYHNVAVENNLIIIYQNDPKTEIKVQRKPFQLIKK